MGDVVVVVLMAELARFGAHVIVAERFGGDGGFLCVQAGGEKKQRRDSGNSKAAAAIGDVAHAERECRVGGLPSIKSMNSRYRERGRDAVDGRAAMTGVQVSPAAEDVITRAWPEVVWSAWHPVHAAVIAGAGLTYACPL